MIDIILKLAVTIAFFLIGWNFMGSINNRYKKVDNEIKSIKKALNFNIYMNRIIENKANKLGEAIKRPSKINFKKLSSSAQEPQKAHEYDAGFDLFADEHQTIKKGQQLKVSTGIAIDIPQGYCGIVTGRSGLSSKTPLRVKTGIIDHGYTGEISVLCDFHSLTGVNGYHIEKGAKIAQLLIIPLALVNLKETDALPDYERGASGFGSTGK